MKNLRKFIFTTNEGYTEDPRGNPVENSQVLGYGCGSSVEEALTKLKNECKWLMNTGFDEVHAYELVSEQCYTFYLQEKSELEVCSYQGKALKEVEGDIWDYHAKGHWIVITTNGSLNPRGECVMGRGVAKEATLRFPNLPRQLGERIKQYGNHVFAFPQYRIFTFPVKHNWWEKADFRLIERSCEELARSRISTSIYLPRPGCGNGKLLWKQVKPILQRYLDNTFVVVHKS